MSKNLISEFCYDYAKLKYGDKAKLYYANKESFKVYTKTNYIYKDIVEDVDTSNYELYLLPKGKHKNLIGLMKGEWGVKIIIERVGLRAKSYSYLIDGQQWK